MSQMDSRSLREPSSDQNADIPVHDNKRDLTNPVLWKCAAIVLVLNLAFYSMAAPGVRVIEYAVCREYYGTHDPGLISSDGWVPERFCKVDAIQRKVAWLLMGNELLGFLGDVFAALPLGLLTTRIGTKPVLFCNCVGQISAFVWVIIVCHYSPPLNSTMVLLQAAFTLFCGSSHVNTALVYSEAAKVSQNRTRVFSFLEAIVQLCQLAGPSVGSALLLKDLWLPFLFAIPLAALSLPLALALPRLSDTVTSSPTLQPGRPWPNERSSLLSHSFQSQESSSPDHGLSHRSLHSNLRTIFASWKSCFTQHWNLVARRSILCYAYAALFIVTLGKQSLHILIQYAAERFDNVSIAEAGFLFTIKAAVVLALYAVLLPLAQSMATVSPKRMDIRLLRTSICLLSIGISLVGFSADIYALVPGLVLYSLGFGFPIVVRSLATAAATKFDLPIPVLYSGIACIETLGSCIGATLLTFTFTKAISMDGPAAGLPFLICGIAYAAIAVPTFLLDFEADTVET